MELVTAVEAIGLCRVSASTLRGWVYRGKLAPVAKLGRTHYYRLDDVLEAERATRNADQRLRSATGSNSMRSSWAGSVHDSSTAARVGPERL